MRQAGQDISGIVDYLSKPILPSVLLDSILVATGNKVRDSEISDIHHGLSGSIKVGLHGKKILLVEDNTINQEVATELLQGNGMEVILAENGLEAVNMVKRQHFDAILMDCQLPVMDGYEATRRIREESAFKDIPIIAITANVMSGDKESSLKAGMNDHIGKPVNPSELFIVLARWLGTSVNDDFSDPSIGRGMEDIKMPEINGLDSKAGLSVVQGNKSFYIDLLSKYARMYEDFNQQFTEALDSDIDGACRLAHSLKGSSGNIGATKVHKAASQLETACRTDVEKKVIQRKFSILKKNLNSLRKELNIYLESVNSGETKDTECSEITLTEEMIRKMTVLLTENDTEAVSYLKPFSSAAGSMQSDSHFKKFIRAVENYDFEQALALLNEFNLF